MVTKMLIEDVLTLLLMMKDCCWSVFRCCVVVCVSRLPLALPLLDRVVVAAAAAAVPVVLGGKDVMVSKMLIDDVLTLLLLIKNC